MACFVSLNIISENWWKLLISAFLSFSNAFVLIHQHLNKQYRILLTTESPQLPQSKVLNPWWFDGHRFHKITLTQVWQYDRPLSTWWVNNNVNNKQPSCNWQTMTLGIISTHIESECNGFRRRQPVSFQVPTNGTVVYNWFSDLPTFLVTCHSVSTEPPKTNGSELLCHN